MSSSKSRNTREISDIFHFAASPAFLANVSWTMPGASMERISGLLLVRKYHIFVRGELAL